MSDVGAEHGSVGSPTEQPKKKLWHDGRRPGAATTRDGRSEGFAVMQKSGVLHHCEVTTDWCDEPLCRRYVLSFFKSPSDVHRTAMISAERIRDSKLARSVIIATPYTERRETTKIFRILPTFRTPGTDWRWRLVISPFSAIFIYTVRGVFIDRGLRHRLSG